MIFHGLWASHVFLLYIPGTQGPRHSLPKPFLRMYFQWATLKNEVICFSNTKRRKAIKEWILQDRVILSCNPLHAAAIQDPLHQPCWTWRSRGTDKSMILMLSSMLLVRKSFVPDPEISCFLIVFISNRLA